LSQAIPYVLYAYCSLGMLMKCLVTACKDMVPKLDQPVMT